VYTAGDSELHNGNSEVHCQSEYQLNPTSTDLHGEFTLKNSERTKALEFLKKNVIGKTVVATPVTAYSEGDRIMDISDDQTFFCNLVEKADGFTFDLTAIARGTRYERDKKGEFSEPEGSLIAVRVYRYEITERRSSGKLLGFGRFVSSTNTQPDPLSGTVFLTRMWLEDGALVVHDTQTGYADFAAAAGTFKPIASDGTYRYTVKDGRLIVEYQQKTFNVDPETLRRTPTKEKLPAQLSQEVDFPPF
jgi:hypothetical protein